MMTTEIGSLDRKTILGAAEINTPACSVALARHVAFHQRHPAVQVRALLQTVQRYSVTRQEGALGAAHAAVKMPVHLLALNAAVPVG
jgi:hypothetical protein